MALLDNRIVHIHPTLLCNLSCAHCYSLSEPTKSQFLPARDILRATKKLRDLGYYTASLSGGEPTVYPEIRELTVGLRQQGFVISVISNGMNLRALTELISDGEVDKISISIDGAEDTHNSIRRNQRSFGNALRAIHLIKSKAYKAGVVIAITRGTFPELPNLVEELIGHGVTEFRFHPISETGRASESLEQFRELDQDDLVRLIFLTHVFDSAYPTAEFHCDAILSHQLAKSKLPDVGETISPIVIKEDGSILPIGYDFSAKFRLGHISSDGFAATYDERLIEVLDSVKRTCSTFKATEFYSELARASKYEAREP